MLGACALYRNAVGSPVEDRCWGFPFEFGWGNELMPKLTIVPERLILSGHNYCAWNVTTGEIDCVSEFASPALENVEKLINC